MSTFKEQLQALESGTTVDVHFGRVHKLSGKLLEVGDDYLRLDRNGVGHLIQLAAIQYVRPA